MNQHRYPCGGITRRGFVLGGAAGLVAGGAGGWLASRLGRRGESAFTGRTREVAKPALAMPGPFPGRVVEVRHPAATNDRNEVEAKPIPDMIREGMCALIGDRDIKAAWRRFFEPGDVVGIKLNPVGRATKPGEGRSTIASISSKPVIKEIVESLNTYAGVNLKDIFLFERYADEFRNVEYDRTARDLGVGWYASSYMYDEKQLLITGQNSPYGRDPHVVGYDPDVFVSMGYSSPANDPNDERRHRSHLSVIVTRMANKIITIPVLKDHKSGGVTLALKNMSHGMNNNVNRSHISQSIYKSPLYRIDGTTSSPNQCNTFIPTAVHQRPLMEKATLHIMDGLIAVYEGGPGSWNRTWGTWRRNSLFFATDPVAMDHVGWDIIDAKRAEVGWMPVARMGNLQGEAMMQLSPRLAAMVVAADPLTGAAILGDEQKRLRTITRRVESFDRRQPEHVALAGTLGLGVFNASGIEHRVVELT
jgi:hypothetical protein